MHDPATFYSRNITHVCVAALVLSAVWHAAAAHRLPWSPVLLPLAHLSSSQAGRRASSREAAQVRRQIGRQAKISLS